MQQGKTSRLNSYEENPAFLTKRYLTHQRAELKRKLSLETLENAMHKFSLPSLKLEKISLCEKCRIFFITVQS